MRLVLLAAVAAGGGCHWLYSYRAVADQAADGRDRGPRPDAAADLRASRDRPAVLDQRAPVEGQVADRKILGDAKAVDQKLLGDSKVSDSKVSDGLPHPCVQSFSNWTVLGSTTDGCEAHCQNTYSISCIPGGSCACQSIVGGWWDCIPAGPDACVHIWKTCCK